LGEGPLEKELKAFAESRQMQHVTFEGFIDGKEKKEIISQARFLVFPSECYESFGYSIIEGQACGVPVVASDIGGAKELVLEGENGFLFETGNPGDLKQKVSMMMALSETEFAEMKQNALRGVKKLYTRDTGYESLSKLFDRLLTLNGGARSSE
jgi:glycosyltransferase involved in cell wall biosynthesis